VFISASPVAHARMGWVVPKHRQTVVRRNRVKRRLREIGRLEVLPRLSACGVALDVLVRARPEAYAATFSALRDELVSVAEELCSGAR
jgi:ribonuclease P protein component